MYGSGKQGFATECGGEGWCVEFWDTHQIDPKPTYTLKVQTLQSVALYIYIYVYIYLFMFFAVFEC